VHFTNASLLPETQGKAQHNKMSKCTDQNGTFLEQYGVVMRVVKCTMKNVLPMLKKQQMHTWKRDGTAIEAQRVSLAQIFPKVSRT
jgi:hypothetical protein